MWAPTSNFNWQLITQNQLQLKERGVVSANYKRQFMFKRSHLTNYCAHVVMSFTFIESPPTHQQESPLHKKLLGSVDSYNEWISCILSWHKICMPQVHQSVWKNRGSNDHQWKQWKCMTISRISPTSHNYDYIPAQWQVKKKVLGTVTVHADLLVGYLGTTAWECIYIRGVFIEHKISLIAKA